MFGGGGGAALRCIKSAHHIAIKVSRVHSGSSAPRVRHENGKAKTWLRGSDFTNEITLISCGTRHVCIA